METNNFSAGISGFMSIKLDRTNYPLWLAQIAPVLKSKNLMGFVDGTTPCPAKFKRDDLGKETTEEDPGYAHWQQKDQMILSWINNSLTPSVLSTVARFTSSRDTWMSLEKSYGSQSQNRILQLRNDLFTTKGDELSIYDFVDKINQIADNLALAGKPIDDDDLVTIIMNNVGSIYEATVSSAQARDKPISYDDLVSLLLSAEMRLKAQNTPSIEVNPTALYAPNSLPANSHGRGYGNHRGSNLRGKGRGRGISSSFDRGRGVHQKTTSLGESFHNTSSRPSCQICRRTGHTAIDCYNRMNGAYEGRVPTRQLTAMAASIPFKNNQSTWISDSGASNHITADLGNLAIHEQYNGNDNVAVGNGAGLKISHIGSTEISHDSSTLKLNNVLHCPNVAANLL